MKHPDVKRLLARIRQGHLPDKDEICFLLGLEKKSDQAELFQAARQVRNRCFGNQIFLYGFLYFSTYCRNDCNFCQYRKSNRNMVRYRKTRAEILTAARQMADAGVHLIDLTMGEDPALSAPGHSLLPDLVREVKAATGLPVMVSPGLVSDRIARAVADAGADWYACYQETHNRDLYARLRPHQDFNARMNAKQAARDMGMLIEEGILTGVGENLGDIADSILWMKAFGVSQSRVMTFVPQAGTPMAQAPPQAGLREYLTIAVMRLIMPGALIPASLDVGGLEGLRKRLDAGACVVTSIVPSDAGLSGVANQSLDIEESRRSVAHVRAVLSAAGLEPADRRSYQAWMKRQIKGEKRT